ncbi:type II secretion system protein GspJ [Pseudomonas sp. CCC3.1]|uniref:type II secretion system protein GspJ n=1 Tax=Pseudomonas sp. CCC3.1 TaxID=3048607 RepID=UPI002AC8B98A|nr:type II secretion system protein GspJ [Pseudomonas sp. CCC3.1]MEB0208518.1 type II secretion system protein GspJ [Pseudomonas sp. CCC3.1]WPX35767.1 type II secretion system protein GspJ [Pseudomonas sp. CCC3.1]
MTKPQAGFTLLELVIAIAIFALLGVACWRLFDGVLRAERSSSAHEQTLRGLQRAVALIERDALHLHTSAKLPGLALYPNQLNVRRANWRNPLGQPRSELQDVSYKLENGVLWRYSQGLEGGELQKQKLLTDVRDLRWRLYDRNLGWRIDWPSGKAAPKGMPQALEMQFSAGRFEQLRRVILLPEGE